MSAAIFKEIKDAAKTRSHEILVFHDVDPRDFEHVQQGLRYRTNYLEQYCFRIHWFAYEKILKVVIPSKLHECAAKWLYEMISEGLAAGTIPKVWVRTMGISPSPEYDNFIGQYRSSKKEGDLTFVPRVGPGWIDAEFPAVVLESGWSEAADQLSRDAALWLRGSGGQVHVVVQVKFFKRTQDRIGARLSINRANPNGASFVHHYEILPADNDVDEDPSITFHEFFAGHCPPGIDPLGCVFLDIGRLRDIARGEIIARGSTPD
ncbi:hypothetical protein HOY82DRAFT_549888, partial [Tuber indicum]